MQAGGILSYFTRHRTVANLLLVLMIGAGLFAFPNMRAQFFPDVVVDNVTVSVAWDGAGAEDVDRAIVELMEPTLLAVEGVESSEATSREGSASIRLEFEPGWDMSRAADDVTAAVDTINDLPEDAEEPTVRRGVWRDRVTDVILTGPVSIDVLARLADEFVGRLYVEGVTRTTVRGVVAAEVVVEVPSSELIRNGITMGEIADAIRAEAEADPAGNVTGANARVRTGEEKRSPEEIAAIVLRTNPDNSQLTIGDIGRVVVGAIDRERMYIRGGDPAMSIRVDRSPAGDAIEIQGKVEDLAADMLLTVPQGVEIDLFRTRAESIQGRPGHPGQERSDRARARGVPALFVPQCPDGLLGGGGDPGCHVLGDLSDVGRWALAQHDLDVCHAHYAWDRGGRCHCRGRARRLPHEAAGRATRRCR